MTAKAGDTVFSLDSISIDSDGVCRALLSVAIVGKNDTRHALRKQSVVVSLSAREKVHLDALRSAVSAQLTSTPPSDLAEAVVVPAESADARMEARRAAHFADRDARHNVQQPPAPGSPPGSAPVHGRKP